MGRYSLYAMLELVGGKKGTFRSMEVCKMRTTGCKHYLLGLTNLLKVLHVFFFLRYYIKINNIIRYMYIRLNV